MLRCAPVVLGIVLASCTCGTPPTTTAPVVVDVPAVSTAKPPTPRPAPIVEVPISGVCDRVGKKLRGASTTTIKALQASCFADSWPAAAIACFAATDTAGIPACGVTLLPAQYDWLRYRMGDADNRPSGWACQQLQAQVNEADACKRFDDDNDPLPEIRATLAALIVRPPEAADVRMVELKCLSIQRIVQQHVASHPCLKQP